MKKFFFITFFVFSFLIGLLCISCPPVDPIPNPHCDIIVTFPDPNLEAVIREEIGKPSGDIYLCEVETITSLLGHICNISDLTGIENLTSLANLGLHFNSISDIFPLVANSSIDSGDYVYLESNPLSSESINTHIPALEARGVNVYY